MTSILQVDSQAPGVSGLGFCVVLLEHKSKGTRVILFGIPASERRDRSSMRCVAFLRCTMFPMFMPQAPSIHTYVTTCCLSPDSDRIVRGVRGFTVTIRSLL